ncbi:SNF2 helicase associated domain-containing protein [Enterococcus camelliae]|uniref:SNF2 helicase associated domain-containing protein n=1 Tax=Enterococcus camelliae TaxID=453959 RepID=A0ABW5TL03_9ENTE
MKWSIPERIIARGRAYLENGRVLSVTPDSDQQVWHAEVLGSELYQVDLDATAKEEDFCQCPYWEEHHYCKHTVAVELYLRQQGKTRQLPKTDTVVPHTFSPVDLFTNGVKKMGERTNSQSVPMLGIEISLESLPTNPYHDDMDVLGIALKIGLKEERKYVVKNIYKFLQVVSEGKKYLANKKHSFLLVQEAFDHATLSLLKTLQAIAQTQQLLGQMGIQVKGKLDKKYLLLPVENATKLITIFQTVPFQFTGNGFQQTSIAILEQETPLQFSVQRQEEHLLLDVSDAFEKVFRFYQLALKNAHLYRLSDQQLANYSTIEQLIKRLPSPQITYSDEHFSSLFRQVLPVLRTIGQVKVADEVADLITEAPLVVTFYLRKKRGMIDAKVHFQYGDWVFATNPAESVVPAHQQQILRDLETEQAVATLLGTLGFQKEETSWQRPIPTGEALYRFFRADIPALQQFGSVKIGQKLRELYLDEQFLQADVLVDEESSWLSIRFDVTGIKEHEIDAMLHSLMQHDQFYTLESGQVVSLETEALQKTAQILTHLRKGFQMKDGVIHLPKNQGIHLQQTLGKDVSYSDEFTEMTNNLIHPEAFTCSLPEGLHAQLRDYQVAGYRWLKMLSHYQFGGILADEMGLGKTLQTICYLLSEKQERQQLQALIVAPASLTYNWLQEIRKFAPSINAVVVSGTKEEREALLQQDVDVRITSYASMRQDIDSYQMLSLDYLILDEAQMVKNSGTKTAQAIRSLEVQQRFALSGTPIENNLDELWSLFQLIMPGFFPSRAAYRQLSAEKIAQMIQPFILRRDKRTVLNDLPEKIEMNYYSTLTTEQKTIYLAYLRQMQEEISQMDSSTFKKNRMSILAGLTRLRQICCDPRLFVEDYQGGSGKLEQVKDLLIAAKQNNRRVLLFSQFTSMLSLLEKELDQLELSHFYLRGSTPPKERLKMVDAFNEGGADVFLISLKAGGTGLNLTGANTVILYDLWWNPAVEEQAAGRAHRMGQKQVVEIWRMISEGTIEERMDDLQNEKRELFQKVIQGNEAQLQQMTEEDIRLILSMGGE